MTCPKPMLAAKVDPANLQTITYPCYIQAKIDGIRCIFWEGQAYGRSLKLLRNKMLQKIAQAYPNLQGWDGELHHPDGYRETASRINSYEGNLEGVTFWVFDTVNFPSRLSYKQRLTYASIEGFSQDYELPGMEPFYIRQLPFDKITSEKELLVAEGRLLDAYPEGIILRGIEHPYKNGRSTLREGGLLKLKRFKRDRGIIKGFVPLFKNNNPQEVNELGLASRSKHQENLIPQETLGALIVEWKGQQFQIGTGFSEYLRKFLWENREKLRGKEVWFKYLKEGMKDKPRHPVFLEILD